MAGPPTLPPALTLGHGKSHQLSQVSHKLCLFTFPNNLMTYTSFAYLLHKRKWKVGEMKKLGEGHRISKRHSQESAGTRLHGPREEGHPDRGMGERRNFCLSPVSKLPPYRAQLSARLEYVPHQGIWA